MHVVLLSQALDARVCVCVWRVRPSVCACVCSVNVCVRTMESVETRDADDDVDVIRGHQFAMSTVCDDTGTAYKCTVASVYDTMRCDTRRDASLTCARKPT